MAIKVVTLPCFRAEHRLNSITAGTGVMTVVGREVGRDRGIIISIGESIVKSRGEDEGGRARRSDTTNLESTAR